MTFIKLWDVLFSIFHMVVNTFESVFDFISNTFSQNVTDLLGDNFLTDLLTWILDVFNIGEIRILDMIIGFSLPLVLLVAIVKFFADLFQN